MKSSFKKLLNFILNFAGFEIQKKSPSLIFTIAGINYNVDKCSVGRTNEGEPTALGAIKMIRERGLKDLRILDVGCGAGIIGMTIFSHLQEIITKMGFVDINIFNINSLKRTLEINNLSEDKRIHYWLSDVLKFIPEEEKFDIIISNPPHFFTKKFNEMTPRNLGAYDKDWLFHKDFYANCHKYLTDRGEVWFLENGGAASPVDLMPFIINNPRLRYVSTINEPLLNNTFFWMITKNNI